jgi:hypothetical protein
MDINYLLEREQVERVRADRAACVSARIVHCQLADGYRALLDDHRRERPATGSAPDWATLQTPR